MNDEWLDAAACRDHPERDELFFGERMSEGRELCRICPVRTPCLDYALEQDVKYGLWGGLTRAQRNLHRTRRQHLRAS